MGSLQTAIHKAGRETQTHTQTRKTNKERQGELIEGHISTMWKWKQKHDRGRNSPTPRAQGKKQRTAKSKPSWLQSWPHKTCYAKVVHDEMKHTKSDSTSKQLITYIYIYSGSRVHTHELGSTIVNWRSLVIWEWFSLNIYIYIVVSIQPRPLYRRQYTLKTLKNAWSQGLFPIASL